MTSCAAMDQYEPAVAPVKPRQDDRGLSLPPQSIAAFRLLASYGRPMSVRLLARRLGVRQQNVYKLMDQLVERGMVNQGKIIIRVYAARHHVLARNAYQRHAAAEFDELFADAYDPRRQV